VSFFYSDERAFYSNKEQDNPRDMAERYIAKGNPPIVLISTPNRPDDIMQRISLELEDKCLYKRLYIDYPTFLGNEMSTPEEIELQKRSPSFEENTTSNS
jgi:hypothetical protein